MPLQWLARNYLAATLLARNVGRRITTPSIRMSGWHHFRAYYHPARGARSYAAGPNSHPCTRLRIGQVLNVGAPDPRDRRADRTHFRFLLASFLAFYRDWRVLMTATVIVAWTTSCEV